MNEGSADTQYLTAQTRRLKPKGKRRAWKEWNHLMARARRASKQRIRRELLRKGLLRGSRILSRARSPQEFIPVLAPKNFSLIQNPDEVLGYFRECGKLLSDRNQLNFDLSRVENLTPDTMALMVAKIHDKRFHHGLGMKGNEPQHDKPRKIFQNSKFLDHVHTGTITETSTSNRLIHKVTDNRVENELAAEICEIAVNNTFGKTMMFHPIYETMIECMANTRNHAHFEKEGGHDWWTLLYADAETKITTFCFVDLGIGILKSAPFKNYIKEKTRVILAVMKRGIEAIELTQISLETVPKLFTGEINLSRTKEKDRGKGLPALHGYSKDSFIKNFVIITNNVYISVPDIKITTLKNNFMGTFLYWELHPTK